MSEAPIYNVYIDESGDLGFNRGRRWFVISAVIKKKDEEKPLLGIMRRIKNELNRKYLHFRELRSYEERSFVVQELKKGDFTFINVLMDTSKFTPQKNTDIKPAILTYNFLCRLLIERVSWFVDDNGGVADIMLSSRGTSRDAELIQYIKTLDNMPNEIRKGVIRSVSSTQANQLDLLQLADVCASSVFWAHEINRFNLRIPCFFFGLKRFLYRNNKLIDSYGLKYFNEDMKPSRDIFEQNLICK